MSDISNGDGTIDITMKVGQLHSVHENPDWPMFSYERPASILWNAIANGLHKRGWSEDKIREWLQSKNPRYALDGSLGTAIEEIGKIFAMDAEKV